MIFGLLITGWRGGRKSITSGPALRCAQGLASADVQDIFRDISGIRTLGCADESGIGASMNKSGDWAPLNYDGKGAYKSSFACGIPRGKGLTQGFNQGRTLFRTAIR